MKLPRLLQVGSVVGAVIVGGAVTGTTTATWTDAAALPPGVLRSGSLGLNVSATDLTVHGNGKNSSLHATVALGRFGEGRHLRATTLLTGVDSGGLTTEIAASNGVGTCQGVAEGRYIPWTGAPVPIVVDESVREFSTPRSICLKLSSPTGWGTSPHQVAMTFTVQQVRDGRPVGWGASAKTTVATGAASKQLATALAAPGDAPAPGDASSTDHANAPVREESSQ